MKKITLLCTAVLASFSLFSQTIVYHENFEIADSVVASGNPAWGPEVTYQAQGLLSYKNQVAASDTSWLTTTAFNTVGNTFVFFEFDQICKIEYFDFARIEVSDDNGVTWSPVTYTSYLGTAPFQALGDRFASAAYAAWLPGNNAATPNNTWWRHETFDISTLAANAAQVKIRFKLYDGNGNGNTSNYGWLIDAVKVTASPSELTPPVITQLPALYSGNVFNLGPYTINDSITDASGIASATLYYTLNSGPQQTVAMTNVSGNHWQGIIPAASDSDTICYYVQAIDASPAANSALLPSSGCTQFVVHAGIVFPFFDDFDGMTLFTVNNISPGSAWELGVPAFAATTGSHSVPNAWDINLTSSYLDNANCYLITPVFDFTAAVNAKLSFWHNYNTESYWDGTRVEYTRDGTTWNVLGTFNDPRGTNWYNYAALSSSGLPGWAGNSAGWYKSTYLLDTLNNEAGPVQFRFIFTSDASYYIDGYSIDDFLIVLPSPQDAQMDVITAPDMSSCLPQGNVPLTVSFTNVGLNNIVGPMNIGYILDNGTPVIEQWNGTIGPLQSSTYTFTAPLNNTPGTHTLTVFTALAGDGFLPDDSLTVTYSTAAGVNVPYINDFESGPSSLIDFCLTNTTQGQVLLSSTAGNNSAAGLAFDATSSLDFDFGSDTIPASPFYIWDPMRSDQQRAQARLIVNTTGHSSLVLEFDAKLLYMWGNEYTNFRVKVNGTMVTPHLMPNNASTPYDTYRYMLSSFLPAPYLIIDFESKVAYDLASTGTGIYLDNIHIYRPDSIDAGVTGIPQPQPLTMASTTTTVVVNIRNFGIDTLTSIPVAYQVAANPVVVETWTGSLLPNATTTYTFTTTFSSPTGAYSLCAWTQLSADTNTFNDSLCKTGFGMPLVTVPWSDNFDGPQNFAAVTTVANSWELGMPLAPNITGTHSGANAWEIDLDAPYPNSCNEYLYSPFFDFSTISNVELRFWQWYSTENYYDGGRVEYTTDGGINWIVLGVAFDPLATSWYNQSYLQSSTLPGWSGNGGGYFQSKYNLALFNNYPTPVQFRYVFTSDNFSFSTVDGWAIDDFELFVPIDAATNTITFGNVSPLPMPGSNNVKINIKNTGTVPINAASLTLKIDNTIVVTDPLTFSPVLAPGASQNHTFSLPWANATPGLHTVKVWSSAPNGLNDVNHLNDTTTWVISVMDTVATYPYCNNFETGNGIPSLTTMNALRFTNSSNVFAQGTPAKNIITSAHGGTQCWMTGLVMNYLRNDSSGIFLPAFTVDTVNCYHLEFWNRYLTEVNKDGGVVEYSFDMGNTWIQLGLPFEANWYNNATATGLGAGWQPNFGGTSNGWILQQHDIRFSQAGQVIFRFRFGADNGIESEGWAIDDVCFNRLPPCVLSVPDVASTDGLNMVVFPNPAGTSSMLQYNLPENGRVTIAMHDMLG
ncbi:MAG: hypothetical protein M3R17_01240, partial [Bacteroidota bacterium]|nr:hypothetical protein [Bacteroidota bacterium]